MNDMSRSNEKYHVLALALRSSVVSGVSTLGGPGLMRVSYIPCLSRGRLVLRITAIASDTQNYWAQ